MMNILMKLLGISLVGLNIAVAAPMDPANIPLKVGIHGNTAPYIMQSGYNQFYGFDISVMEYICNKINRPCQYIPMSNQNLYKSIDELTVDLGLGSVVITPHKSFKYQFSIPYMISQGQFITRAELAKKLSEKADYNEETIGVVRDTAFEKQLSLMLPNMSKVTYFSSSDDLISALKGKKVDMGFIDHQVAEYWEQNSNHTLQGTGTPISVGFGLGILVNPQEPDLLKDVNQAILDYQNSQEFKKNYELYLN